MIIAIKKGLDLSVLSSINKVQILFIRISKIVESLGLKRIYILKPFLILPPINFKYTISNEFRNSKADHEMMLIFDFKIILSISQRQSKMQMLNIKLKAKI